MKKRREQSRDPEPIDPKIVVQPYDPPGLEDGLLWLEAFMREEAALCRDPLHHDRMELWGNWCAEMRSNLLQGT